MTSPDFCSRLNLPAIEQGICKAAESLVYKVYEHVEPKLPILTNGIEEIIKKNATKIFIYDTIMQQLPWFITFLILIIILRISRTITTYVFLILLIFVILITGILIAAYMYYNKNNLEKLVNETRSQFNLNIRNFRQSVLMS